MAETEDKKTTPTKRKAPAKTRRTSAKTATTKSKAPVKKTPSTRAAKSAPKATASTAKPKTPPKTESPHRSASKKMSWSGAFWHITALILFAVLAGFLVFLVGGLSIAVTLTKSADIEIAQINNLRDFFSHWLKDCLRFVLEEETEMPFPFRPIEHGPKRKTD